MYAELATLIKKWYPEIAYSGSKSLQIPAEWPESVKRFCTSIPLDDAIWSCQDTLLFPDQIHDCNDFVIEFECTSKDEGFVYISCLTEAVHSILKFLLICPTPALEKKFDPRNTASMPAVKFLFRLGFEQII